MAPVWRDCRNAGRLVIDVRGKVDKLVALALHEATPAEEARTAALTALRLASKHGWKLGPSAPAAEPRNGGGYSARDYYEAYTARAHDPADWSPGSRNREAYDRAQQAENERMRAEQRRREGAAAAEQERRDRGPNGGRPRRGQLVREPLWGYTCATCGERGERMRPAWREETDSWATWWHADCADP